MKASKIKNYLIFGYILMVFVGFNYIRYVLNHTPIVEYNKDKEAPQKTHPINVTLIVSDKKTFSTKMSSDDTVSDFLNRVRDDDKLYFERTSYIYGTVISEVDQSVAPAGYSWKITKDGVDITLSIDSYDLQDNDTYKLDLVKD